MNKNTQNSNLLKTYITANKKIGGGKLKIINELGCFFTKERTFKKLFVSILVFFSIAQFSFGQCGDGSTGNGDCGSFGGASYIADVTTVPSVGLNTWNTLSTTNLSKPYWVFKNVQRGTIIRLANCTGEDSEFSISGPSGFTYIKRDGDNEFNVGLGCSPNDNDESMYLYCTQTGDYNISIIRNGCNNFSNAGTKYLYWNVTNRPCAGGTSYGSGVWNGYVYDGTGPDYFYGSIGTQTANNINVDWGTGQPINSGCGQMCDVDNFSTEWFMNQTYSDGVYVFSTPGNDDGRLLSSNGASSWNLINDWGAGSGTTTTAPTAMSGNYNMVFYQRENSGGAKASLTTCQMDAAGTAGSLGNATTAGTSGWNMYYYDAKNYNFTVATYRGTDQQGSSTPTSASLNVLWGGVPNRVGQVCGTSIGGDFSLRALLTRSFTKGIYQFATGGDDNSRISINGGTPFNVTTSNSNTTSEQGMSGSTALEYQNWDNGGDAATRVSITCLNYTIGTLSSNQLCDGTPTNVTLTWSGGRGWGQLERSTDGTNWLDVPSTSELAQRSTDGDRTWAVAHTNSYFYRVRVTSCNGTAYTNIIAVMIGATTNITGNYTIPTGANITLSGTINISGDFTLPTTSTITLLQGCPLVINANNITINGTINGDGKGGNGGNGGNGGSAINDGGDNNFGANGGKGLAGAAGSGTGKGSAGSDGSNGNGGKAYRCGTGCVGTYQDGYYNGGSGGGGGGAYGGNGGSGANGANGGYFASYSPANGGGAASQGITYGDANDVNIDMGSGGSGAGGGGGGWGAGTKGGNGGYGGGVVTLKACQNLTIAGTVTANGTNGGNGGNGGGRSTDNTYNCTSDLNKKCGGFACSDYGTFGATGGAGGGAGGGSGGGILLQAFGVTTISGNISAIGGKGGDAGSPKTSNGACFDNAGGGGGGSGGRIKIITNPCQTHNISPTVSVSNGSGGINGSSGGNGTYNSTITHPSYTALDAKTITTTNYAICNGTNPNTAINAEASTGGANNASLPCTASLPAYQYQWYVTKTACAGPQTGTVSTAASGWGAITGATNQNMSTTDILNGINQVGSTTTATTYCFQRRTQSSNCYAWTGTVSVSIQTVPTAGAIDINNIVLCGSGSVNLTNTTAGTGDGTISYRWEASTISAASGFNPITGSSATNSYAVTQTTWFRRITISTVLSTPCESVPSNVVVVYTNDGVTSGNLATATAERTCLVNDNSWHYFRDDAGNIIAAIKSNGENLGNVKMKVTINPSNNTTISGTDFYSSQWGDGGIGREGTCKNEPELTMRRWYTITPQIQPPAGKPTSILLFFTNADYTNYKNEITTLSAMNLSTASYAICYGYTSSVTDLAVNKDALYDIPIFSTNANGGPSNSIQYQLSIPSFSDFYFHTNGGIGMPLPVELVSFTGWNQGSVNILKWVTASELNTSYFEVQHSTTSNNWEAIGRQKAAGNSNTPLTYDFTDNNPQIGVNYYRLKMVDNNGTFKYSNVINIQNDRVNVNEFSRVYPNPTSGNLTVEILSTILYNTEISVLDILGRNLLDNPATLTKGLNTLQFNFSHLPKGTYILRFSDTDGKSHYSKFVRD